MRKVIEVTVEVIKNHKEHYKMANLSVHYSRLVPDKQAYTAVRGVYLKGTITTDIGTSLWWLYEEDLYIEVLDYISDNTGYSYCVSRILLEAVHYKQ